jgi:hypothetical protein
MEKTIEELKTENETLKTQFLEITEKVKGLSELMLATKEYNVKLAYSIRLFAELHLTREEKLAIAQEFDRAINSEQVEKIYQKYSDQVVPPGVDIEPDYMWSPGFIRDMEKYYFHYKGYNPFEVIDGAVKILRNQFRIEDELRVAEDQEKLNKLREAWEVNREASLVAVDEILSVTNEILKK